MRKKRRLTKKQIESRTRRWFTGVDKLEVYYYESGLEEQEQRRLLAGARLINRVGILQDRLEIIKDLELDAGERLFKEINRLLDITHSLPVIKTDYAPPNFKKVREFIRNSFEMNRLKQLCE